MNVRLLLDVTLPDDDGLAFLQQLVGDQPAAVIVLEDPAVRLGARLMGALPVYGGA